MARGNNARTSAGANIDNMQAPNVKLFAFALLALILVGSLMVECTPKARVQDFEFMDLKDLYDMIQQNDLRPKKARSDYVAPLRMRFGRSDPWISRGPLNFNGDSLGANSYPNSDQP